ncbi:hypothetical protein [Alkalihalobacillus sp. BA299]|uniref:hypothetical protein n=1 Tax=Alkalihalobacillus sp. BA299 TaxID=2815938 RepID=UPI001ADB7BAD|nr:hypothetical protein [Alkalihalobacillus sp. BA299]
MPEPLLKNVVYSSVVIPPTSIGNLPSLPSLPLNAQFPFSSSMQSFLSGRELLLDELPFTLQDIDEHYRNGYIEYTYGIKFSSDRPACARCGNEENDRFASFMCARCIQLCSYCRKCIMLGRVSQCTPLVRWIGPLPTYEVKEPVLAWNGELSPEQSVASEKLVDAIAGKTPFLIWAVWIAGNEYAEKSRSSIQFVSSLHLP